MLKIKKKVCFCLQFSFRFNVALTRAKALMIVVGNPNLLIVDSNWKALIDYVQEKGSF